jgi:hypothetical protein
MCVEIKIQIDQRIRYNRRISCGEIAFEISIRVFKDASQYRLKAQAKSFYSDEMRKFTEQNTVMSRKTWLLLSKLASTHSHCIL